uniref:Uncharacterized protein n=1 Tax=Pipistrellus kuhlii TaxID=59472 RepID=A0A7J7Y990_PIPKU|nr:hypothetical protein mPipKuh1_010345 [Pipistrellus kuhlii]
MPSPSRAPPAPLLHPPLQKLLLLLLGPFPVLFLRPSGQCSGPAASNQAWITRGARARTLGSPASLRLGETRSRRPQSGRRTARPPAHRHSPAGEGMRPPRGSHGWGGPARAPRATEETRSVPGPLRHPLPGRGHPAHRPLPAPERKVPAAARERQWQRQRQRQPRGQRGKKDTHPHQPRALTAPEIVTSPLPR